MDKVLENELLQYLTGKTIAVVGNAQSIGNEGNEIDLHDIIIRFNNFRTKGLEERIGTKTHIWCHCNHREQADAPRSRNEKFAYQWYPRQGVLKELNSAPYYVCDAELDASIPIKRPSTGISLLNWLYNHGFQFDCYGFDGFETKNFDGWEATWHCKEDEKAEYNRLQENKTVEAVIPYRDEFSRKLAFQFVLAWSIRQFDKVHVEIANRATTLNKSQLFNQGLSRINPKSLAAFIDADIFITDEALRKTIAAARKHRKLTFPYSRCMRLDKESTLKLIKTQSLDNCRGMAVKGGCGGYLMVPASIALEINGWDERFIEWGGEDEAFYLSAKLVTGKEAHRLDETCYHLWHTINGICPNKKRITKYRSMNLTDLLEEISTTKIAEIEKRHIETCKRRHKDQNEFRGNAIEIEPLDKMQKLITRYKCQTGLDYGCGKGLQYSRDNYHKKLGLESIALYDPAVAKFSKMPEGKFDVVIATAVFHHIPIWVLPKTLKIVCSKAKKFVYLGISTKKSQHILSDGTVMPPTIKSVDWWKGFLKKHMPSASRIVLSLNGKNGIFTILTKQ